jgi:tetratricopeptide (TPR) repeat protein
VALRPSHKSTLKTVNNLGDLYKDQDKLKDAKTMYQRAQLDATDCRRLGSSLHGPRQVWGCREGVRRDIWARPHIDVKNCQQPRLSLYNAEAMYQRALVAKEKVLGLGHQSTLRTVNNLGGLYKDQGKFEDAETMYQRALVGFRGRLGPNHMSTLEAINNLGNLYKERGKFDDAETMYERALIGLERALESDQKSTLETVNDLRDLYMDQGKLDAEAIYRRALVGFEKALGSDHKSTLETVNHLGDFCKDQGELTEAGAMYQRALRERV